MAVLLLADLEHVSFEALDYILPSAKLGSLVNYRLQSSLNFQFRFLNLFKPQELVGTLRSLVVPCQRQVSAILEPSRV